MADTTAAPVENEEKGGAPRDTGVESKRPSARRRHAGSKKRTEHAAENASSAATNEAGTAAGENVPPVEQAPQAQQIPPPSNVGGVGGAGAPVAAAGTGLPTSPPAPEASHTAIPIAPAVPSTTPSGTVLSPSAQPLLGQFAQPVRKQPSAAGGVVSSFYQWVRSTFHAGSGGLRGLAEWDPQSTDLPHDKRFVAQTGASIATSVPTIASEHPDFTVPVIGPVLGLRIGRLLGTSEDPYVVKPFVRVHVVDSRTGNYLVPSRCIQPQQNPHAPPLPSEEPAVMVYDATSLSTRPPGCFGLVGEAPNKFNPKLYVNPQDTQPCLNRELDVDIISSLRACVGSDNLMDLEVSSGVLQKTPFGDTVAGAADAPSLLWNEYLVLDCPLTECLQPHVVILLEVLDDQTSLPKPGLDFGRGVYRIGWSFFKLLSRDGTPNVNLERIHPMGFSPAMVKITSDQETRWGTPVDMADAVIPLYGYQGPYWSDRVDHSAVVRAATPSPASPSPDVSIQYRARERRETGLSLEVAPFGAVIPACRYVHRDPKTMMLTFFDKEGKIFQQEVQYPLWKRFEAKERILLAGVSMHPSMGRPNFAVRLPTDVLLERPLELGASAVAAKQVLSPRTDEPVKQASSKQSKYARGKNEFCLLPDQFIGSVPTGKMGAMSVSFSPDGLLVALGCVDDLLFPIRIFDVETLQEVCKLTGHASIIYQLSWSPDSQWLASASGDGTACVWYIPHSDGDMSFSNVSSVPAARCLHTPASYVYSAKFHPTAPHLLVTGAFDHGLRLWDTLMDIETRKPMRNDDGQPEYEIEAEFLGFIGDDPKSVAPGSVESHACHEAHVNVVEFDTAVDGSTRKLISADGNGCIMIWEVPDATSASNPAAYKLMRTLRPAALRGVPIVSIKVRPGSNQMMVLGHQNILRLFDLSTFGAIRSYPNVRCTSSRLEIAFSPDGAYVSCGGEDGVLCMWSVDKGEISVPRAKVEGGRRALIAFPGVMYGVAWHPTQHIVAVCSFGAGYPGMLCGARGATATT